MEWLCRTVLYWHCGKPQKITLRTQAGRGTRFFSRLSLAMSGGMYELLQVKTMEEYTRFCVTP